MVNDSIIQTQDPVLGILKPWLQALNGIFFNYAFSVHYSCSK